MSTTSRLISGSAASWMRIIITMITQVALIPIYLSYWSAKTFGIWIAVQALANILSTLDRGHVEFLGYEFLKTGRENRSKIGKDLWSGFWISLIVGALEFILICVWAFSNNLSFFLGEKEAIDHFLLWQAGLAIILQWIGWTFFSNTSGLFFRALTTYGYYPRMGWWNVIITIVSSIIPVIAVILGANLLVTAIASSFGLFLITIPQFIDIFKLLAKEKISNKTWSLKDGLKNYKTSLVLSGKFFLENFRQQGVRLILAPLVGVTGLTAFSTIRTAANVAQQGLLTITQPLLPELIRFVKNKDQLKTEIAFDTVWLVIVMFLAPIVIILQAIAGPLFILWTKGQVNFNPSLFALLSQGVLVFALAQPAMAIIIGHNLLKTQIFISTITSMIVICGVITLLPSMGISGAGLSLLLAETISAIWFQKIAKEWLQKKELVWPTKAANITITSVIIAAICMYLMILLPVQRWVLLIISLLLLLVNVWRYWKNMSPIATHKIKSLIEKIPLLKKLEVINN